ncbi:MAG: hypothetical protein H0X62_09615 [Bacteroidetes bacterium]|nr:hypothetical protein [Bacteroidota bacterium]
MKRRLVCLGGGLLFASMSILIGCKKEELSPKGGIMGSKSLSGSFRSNNVSLEDIITHDEVEETNINRLKFQLAEGLLEIICEEEIKNWMINELKERKNVERGKKFISFEELFNRYPEIKVNIESVIKTYNGENTNFDWLTNQLVRRNINYIPVIYIPNIEVASTFSLPLVSPGVEIEDVEINGEMIDDDLFSWQVVECGGLVSQIRLGESEAMAIQNPLFVISLDDNDSMGLSNIETTVSEGDEVPMMSLMSTTSFSSNEYKINHRYDKSNNSEFTITGKRRTPPDSQGFTVWVNIFTSGIYNDPYKVLASVHKNQVGTQLYKWMHFANNWLPYSTNLVYFNTYERDWFASPKKLGAHTPNNALWMEGQMTFADEWYMFDANSNFANNRVNFQSIFDTWANWYTNTKGNFTIWRV